ncbi:hypothetical protein BA177_14055 [Woeseia oceani]|uniref:Uncharacterized protein n=1 Tax=Woeseia oceani TaxID=1548547 RepID=A0A193LI36_9GAMM|nr:hypothetical protein BA177_14055 [Woeseia oceani]
MLVSFSKSNWPASRTLESGQGKKFRRILEQSGRIRKAAPLSHNAAPAHTAAAGADCAELVRGTIEPVWPYCTTIGSHRPDGQWR